MKSIARVAVWHNLGISSPGDDYKVTILSNIEGNLVNINPIGILLR